MNSNWQHKKYSCTKCQTGVEFRVAYKKIQHLSNGKFVDLANSAAIVLCESCGGTFWVPAELKIISEVK